MEQAVLPVLVAFHTGRCIRAAVDSFHRHFPGDMVLVVDNNPGRGEPGWTPDCDAERSWLRAQPDVLLLKNDGPGKGHGAGVDRAVAWCREGGVELMLHFEPDCLVTGRRWYDALRAAVDRGAWMAGSHRKRYGPIHPTPSLWRVDRIATSFEVQPRGADARHPLFHQLVDVDWLTDTVREEGGPWAWWRDHWDTGQRAWFQAAVLGRAEAVPETDDFHHFWYGSTARRDRPAFTGGV